MRLFVFLSAALIGTLALGQAPNASTPSPTSAASATAKPAKTDTKPAAVLKITKPAWIDLNPGQQSALSPLKTEWPKISETQKRKWLEISKNFGKLQPDEQTKLHGRMSEWVALSPQQRAAARLNFSVAKTLTPEEKQEQWQAYQALSPAEKQKLAASAKDSTPNSAALANKSQNKALPVSKLQPEK
jgi:ADP-heptose:LPS heptosyltransferase